MGTFFQSIIKFILGIAALPYVVACASVFYQHINSLPSDYGDFFRYGTLGFLLVFLFIYQFWGVFEFGQTIMSNLLQFLSPLDTFLVRIIPFYVTIILLIFFLIKTYLSGEHLSHYFLFFAGFAFAMHILLTAQDLQDAEKTSIKPAYLFSMCVIFVFNVFFVVALVDLVRSTWSVPTFFKATLASAQKFYVMVFDKVPFVS